MKKIIEAFDRQPIINLKGRRYILNPLIDHMPNTPHELILDVVKELSKLTDLKKVNKIVGEEDRGGYIAALIAYKNKKDLAMVKWNPLGLEGDHAVNFRNAYTKGKMYLHGISKGDKVILVEDLIDSGGTIIAMIKLLKRVGVKIYGIIAVAEKIDYHGREKIRKATGYDVKCLLKVSCSEEKSTVVWVNGKNIKNKNS